MNSNLSNKSFSTNYSLGTGIFIRANSNLVCVLKKKRGGGAPPTKYLMKIISLRQNVFEQTQSICLVTWKKRQVRKAVCMCVKTEEALCS